MKEKKIPPKIPPRLTVLLASRSTQAIVICRHTSKRTVVIGWDRKTDEFEVGQWFKGKIYPYNSDISPDGKYWIYFAMSGSARMYAFLDKAYPGALDFYYTVLAKVPYLKALDFYPRYNNWHSTHGGGLFLSNRKYLVSHSKHDSICRYWVNYSKISDVRICKGLPTERKTSRFEVERNDGQKPSSESAFSNEYFWRLKRDGWQDKGYKSNGSEYQTFYKNVNDYWCLIKVFHWDVNHPIGRGYQYESYKMHNKKSRETTEYPNWEWADRDGDRVVWAENGKIFSGKVTSESLNEIQELFDTTSLQFEALKAPY